MTNIALPRLDMYKDVATFNIARIASKLLPKKSVLKLIQRATRENARTPVQWSDAENAGFSTAEPWFSVNPNYKQINVEAQEDDPGSLLNFYRRLLAFRKNNAVALYGTYKEYRPKDKDFYVYERRYGSERLLVICCFASEFTRFDAPEGITLDDWTLELSNYDGCFVIGNGFTARPYELRVYSLG